MASEDSRTIEEIREDRLFKRRVLEERGINPYALTANPTHTAKALKEHFDEIVQAGELVTVVGRVMSLRTHGGSVFFDVFDGTAQVQGYIKKDDTPDAFALFADVVDRSDFVEITGTGFYTKRGEPTVHVASWRMLTKSMMPVPDQWYGLKDDEERYRKRYLDLLLDEGKRELFVKKSKFWSAVRAFLLERDFLEVETPTLELTTGGAEATPFQTRHRDFDMDVYLRISIGELWQKRLMAAGFPKTFEIGRVYRNEGSSPEHLQEFSNMEFYAAYLNFDDGKEMLADLYRTVAEEVFGTTSFESRGYSFDLADEWRELDYVSTVREITGVDVLVADETELKSELTKLGVEHEGENRERLTDSLWKYCRKRISGPAFLINHPKFIAPLSKTHPDDARLTKKLQVIIAGSEMGTAYAELNDPIDQRKRFEEQQALRAAGDTEAMMPDWEFVEMLEYGMPPTFGFGFGERFFSALAGLPIRETQLFPLLRPRGR